MIPVFHSTVIVDRRLLRHFKDLLICATSFGLTTETAKTIYNKVALGITPCRDQGYVWAWCSEDIAVLALSQPETSQEFRENPWIHTAVFNCLMAVLGAESCEMAVITNEARGQLPNQGEARIRVAITDIVSNYCHPSVNSIRLVSDMARIASHRVATK